MIALLLERAAQLLTERRMAVLGAIGLVTLGAALALPQLEADASPERLMTGDSEHTRAADRLRAHFGDTDDVVLVLVSARDLLEPGPLTYVHRISRRLARLPGIERVDGLTVTPIPRRTDEPGSHTLTLSELELEDDDSDTAPEVLDAMAAIARADPEHFPDGVPSVAEQAALISRDLIVRGEVVSSAQVRALEDALAEAPLVDGRLVSDDRRVALVAVSLAEGDGARRADQVQRLNAVLAEDAPPEGVEVIVGGLPHLRASIIEKMADDQTVLVPATLLVCVVFLWLGFRWIPGTVLPLTVVGITGVVVMGGMAMFGQQLDILTNIVPALLIIIGISDSIHFLGRYRHELRTSVDRRTAARRTFRHMALACLLTSLTTAAGLGSLVVSETPMLRRFAIVSSVGVMIAYAITVAFLPAAMTAFAPPPRTDPRAPDLVERVVVALTRPVLRHPWPTLAASALALLACTAIALRVDVGSRLLEHFDEEDEVWRAAQALDSRLDGVRPLEVLVSGSERERFRDPEVLGAIDRTARWFEGLDGVRRVTTHADQLHEVWFLLSGDPAVRTRPFVSREQIGALATITSQSERDPLLSHLSADGQVLRIEARLADVGAARTLALVDDLEERLGRELSAVGAADLEVAMAGEAFTGSRGSDVVLRDLLGSLLMAVGLIFGLLVVLLRSVRLGLVSIPPNVLPLVGTMAWMTVRGIPLDIATLIIFSIGVGLAVDGTIHVLVRFREERARGEGGLDDALLRAARGTGGAIVIATVALAMGFGVMLLSSFVPVRHFGELIAVTVIGCLVATIVVLPALLKVSYRHGSSGRGALRESKRA